MILTIDTLTIDDVIHERGYPIIWYPEDIIDIIDDVTMIVFIPRNGEPNKLKGYDGKTVAVKICHNYSTVDKEMQTVSVWLKRLGINFDVDIRRKIINIKG